MPDPRVIRQQEAQDQAFRDEISKLRAANAELVEALQWLIDETPVMADLSTEQQDWIEAVIFQNAPTDGSN